MFNKKDQSRNACMLQGKFRKKGYDWWWHSFTAKNEKTGEEKPFFIEYYLCNPALRKEEPIFEENPSYLMVKVGCWGEDACQLHRFFSWNEIEVYYGAPYKIIAGDCYASETRLKGSVSVTEQERKAYPEYLSDAGSISFDLAVEKQVAFNVGYGAGKLFRALKAFEMYWHAEGMKTQYSGTIVYNGETYVVEKETSYGYADKNWGSDFTSPWVWISSNHLISNRTGKKLTNSVFDIGGGRPKVLGIPLNRKLLSAFWYEGTPYEFNFSKFWTGTRTAFSCIETEKELVWKVRQETRTAVMETELTCEKKDMLLIRYVAPNGKRLHNRLWNGGNGTGRILLYKKQKGNCILIDDIKVMNAGCEYGEYGDGKTPYQ